VPTQQIADQKYSEALKRLRKSLTSHLVSHDTRLPLEGLKEKTDPCTHDALRYKQETRIGKTRNRGKKPDHTTTPLALRGGGALDHLRVGLASVLGVVHPDLLQHTAGEGEGNKAPKRRGAWVRKR